MVRLLFFFCFLENFNVGLERRLSWSIGVLVSGGWVLCGEGSGGL